MFSSLINKLIEVLFHPKRIPETMEQLSIKLDASYRKVQWRDHGDSYREIKIGLRIHHINNKGKYTGTENYKTEW